MDINNLSEQDQPLATRLRSAGITQSIWPILVNNVRHLFAVSPHGLEIAGPTAEASIPWDQVRDLDLGTFAIALRDNESGTITTCSFMDRWQTGEASRAIQAARPNPNATGDPMGAHLAAADPDPARPAPAAPTEAVAPASAARPARPALVERAPARPASSLRDAHDAQSRIQSLFITGLVLQVIGGVVMGASWPETTTSYDALEDSTSDTAGSVAGVVVGSLVAWSGLLAIAVALIAWGVMLGRRASPPAH